MDLLAVQSSLAGLEERFNELQEVAESRFLALLDERDARAKEKGEAQQAVEELRKQLEVKGGELEKVVGERDARAKEKGEAQQAVEELSRQLDEKGVALQKMVGERDARAEEKGEAQQAVEDLKKQLQQASESLMQMELQVKDSSVEADLTMLQLHQVQEELEHYFLLSRKQSAMLNSSSQLYKKAETLLMEAKAKAKA